METGFARLETAIETVQRRILHYAAGILFFTGIAFSLMGFGGFNRFTLGTSVPFENRSRRRGK